MFRSLIVTVLTLTLGIFFILVGQFKVTPQFFPDIHADMKHEFGRFNKVFPLYQSTGWRPYAKTYRLAVGLTELICGTILILIPGRLKTLANFVLLCVMVGAVYTHYALNDKFDRMTPGLIFALLLLTRLIVSRTQRTTTPPLEVNKKKQ